MFVGGLERFSGRETVLVEQAQVIIVVHGEFHLQRIFSHFGMQWSVEMPGTWLLLPPGTYVAQGDALLYVGGERQVAAAAADPAPGLSHG